jgi:antitoxin component of MazEF toxin-antitoxin module
MYTIKYTEQFGFFCFIMVKKLIQHGNSVALVIDKPIMEILNITNETTFELTTDGRNLILSPQNEYTQEKDIINSLEKINKKYGSVLKRLGE